MPIFRLGDEPEFPPPELAHPSGILAIGGKLTVEWLLAAYRDGIFPWYNEPPIEWWCPHPRLVLWPHEINVSRSLQRTLRRGHFTTTLDTAFREVIHACATTPRRGQPGTWICDDIKRGYADMHDAGYAHSVETWADGELVGGIYGIALGGVFFGESMFSRRSDASKVALVELARQCEARNIEFIDCQVRTDHLVSMGAREISRTEFLRRVRRLVKQPARIGPWT